MASGTSSVRPPAACAIGPFVVEYAAGRADRAAEYRLRHEVFVEERGYLPAAADRLERRDEFDDAAVAVLLRDAATGEAAACQRLILPERLDPAVPTNVERFIDPARFDLAPLPRATWAEVSRTTVAPAWRWRAASGRLTGVHALTCASLALAIACDRTTLLSVSDPSTAALTRRMGFPITRIGATVDFHGARAAFLIDVARVRASLADAIGDRLEALVADARRRATFD
jgi:N-acyl-L-homoserine lactone synthetase